ncbi:MAG TPA: biotin--[acetyl-CoA-carboxylase] ligase [Longimicrobiales bacterium]|nr:biotin--[acetyl-CoA-carboxylase] ligase [Longimicrobiales bacterium]
MSGPSTHWQGEPVSVWRALWGVAHVEAWERIGSTNDRALELLESAARGGKDAAAARGAVVVLAEEQTAGRGRRGARWHSAPGAGLWMSVGLRGTAAAHLPLRVGLAAAQALEAVAPGARVGIKWPNDLVIGGRKVGGVLCESAPGGVVAGVGINLAAPPGGWPEGVEGLATSLQDEGFKPVRRSDLAGRISRGVARLADDLGAPLGEAERAALAARDVLAGREVVTEEHGRGTARGIDPEGALLLERPDGSCVRVLAGSVRLA